MLRIRIVLLVLAFLLGCQRGEKPVQSIDDLQARIAKINKMNDELETRRSELNSLIREYNATHPDSARFDVASFDTMASPEEQQILREMFKNEKDISYHGLLKTIYEKNQEIGQLQAQINDLRATLPKPYVVQPGDTHYEVVLNYLTQEQHLPLKDALKVAWRTSLIDEILPGNEIWLMYKDNIVGSFVTQGTAKRSPMAVHVAARQRLLARAAAAEKITLPSPRQDNN